MGPGRRPEPSPAAGWSPSCLHPRSTCLAARRGALSKHKASRHSHPSPATVFTHSHRKLDGGKAGRDQHGSCRKNQPERILGGTGSYQKVSVWGAHLGFSELQTHPRCEGRGRVTLTQLLGSSSCIEVRNGDSTKLPVTEAAVTCHRPGQLLVAQLVPCLTRDSRRLLASRAAYLCLTTG